MGVGFMIPILLRELQLSLKVLDAPIPLVHLLPEARDFAIMIYTPHAPGTPASG